MSATGEHPAAPDKPTLPGVLMLLALGGLPDGGARWRGVNVGAREYAVGSQCLPVECSVVAGDIPSQWL